MRARRVQCWALTPPWLREAGCAAQFSLSDNEAIFKTSVSFDGVGDFIALLWLANKRKRVVDAPIHSTALSDE
jgi:hypothetical protein